MDNVSGVSWQKVGGSSQNGELFKPRKAVCRHPGTPSRSQTNMKVNVKVKTKPSQRPKTTIGFEDYFDDTESSGKQKALSIKRSLQEVKRMALLCNKTPHRNCVSSLGEKLGKSKNIPHAKVDVDMTSDRLGFTEKLRSFRALISPPLKEPTKNDISNEKIKKTRNLSHGVEIMDNHIKFKSTSSDKAKNKLGALNEFQLTYEHDKKRAKDDSSHYLNEEPPTDSFHKENVVAVIKNLNVFQKDTPRDIEQDDRDQRLNELQLTYEQDRTRRSHLHDCSNELSLNKYSSDLELQKTRKDNYFHSNNVKANSIRKVIKRPTDILASHDNERPCNVSPQKDNTNDSLFNQQHRLLDLPTAIPGENNKSDKMPPSDYHKIHSDSHLFTDISSERKTPTAEENNTFKKSKFNNRENQSTAHSVRLASDKIVLEDHSGTPTLVLLIPFSNQENLGSNGLSPESALVSHDIILQPGNLKTHQQIAGANPTRMLTKLNERSESDIQTLRVQTNTVITASVDDVLSQELHDIETESNSNIREHRNSPFVSLDVHASFKINHSLSRINTDVSAPKFNQKYESHSIETSEKSSTESNNPLQSRNIVSQRQTNVKIYDTSQNSSITLSQTASKRSGSRNSFRADSPKQTNLCLKTEIMSPCFVQPVNEKVVKYSSELKQGYHKADGKYSSCVNKNIDIYNVNDASDKGYGEDFLQENFPDDKSGRSGLDLKDIHTRNDSPGTFLKPEGKRVYRTDYYQETSPHIFISNASDRQQETPTNVDYSRDIMSNGNFMTMNTLERGPDSRRTDLHKVQDECGSMSARRRILAKRPHERMLKNSQNKFSEEVPRINSIFTTHSNSPKELEVERSRSALDIYSRKYNSINSAKHNFQERKRPQSSFEIERSSGRNPSQPKNQQIKHRVHDTLSRSSSVPLVRRVLQLHYEVDQRLMSKENFLHGVSRFGPKNVVNRHEARQNEENLSDVSTIKDGNTCNGKIHSSKTRTNFATSTPVKQTPGKLDEDRSLKEPSLIKYSISAENGTRIDKSIEAYINIDNTDSKISKGRQMYLTDSLKKIISSKNSAHEDNVNHKQVTKKDIKYGVQNNGRDLADLHSAEVVVSLESSETDKQDYLNDSKKRSQKLPPCVVDSQIQTMNHQEMTGQLLATGAMSKDFCNQGRASPAESLLNHLDNPDVVTLLQKLYKADHKTRLIIMIQVQFFKAWQCYTVSSREHRARKRVLTQKSLKFCVQRRLFCHFNNWQFRASNSRKMRQAVALCHFHMLTKAMKALRWSVNQSKHLSQQLCTIIHALKLKASFNKWKTAAAKQRRERFELVIKKWKQYVAKTQKTRHIQQVLQVNIMMDVLRCWKKCYNRRAKRNTAFSLFRRNLLRQAFSAWKDKFSLCRRKKEKYSVAVSHHKNILTKTNFNKIVASFKKAQKAKNHFRNHQISKVFGAWRKAIEIFMEEKETNMAVSHECWEKQRLKQYFSAWREKLVISIAAKRANTNICRKSFTSWRQAWQSSIKHYQEIEETLMLKKLHLVFLRWRRNVAELQERYRLAVSLIENCYLRHIWDSWKTYKAKKEILKKKAQLHSVARQHKILSSCFTQWQVSYNHCRREKLTKQLWSEDCARQMASRWKSVCYRRSLLRLYENSQSERDQRLLKVMLAYWKKSLERYRRDTKQAEDLLRRIQQQHLLLLFQFWKCEAQRVVTIKPLIQRQEKQLLTKFFDTWRDYVLNKSRCKQNQKQLQRKILWTVFSSWRKHFQACQTEKMVKNKISRGLLLCFLQEWWFLIHRKQKGRDFNTSRLIHRTFHTWKNRAVNEYTHKTLVKQEKETKLMLKREYFLMWLNNIQNQVAETNVCVYEFWQKQNKTLITKKFILWRRHMQSMLVARAYQNNHFQRLQLTLLLAWREVTNKSVSGAVQRFSEKIGLINISVQESEAAANGVNNQSLTGNFHFSFQRLSYEEGKQPGFDTDRMVLLSGGLQASLDNRRVKRQRLKETVATIIHRLRHWPVCVAFDQWKEFTVRECRLRQAYNRLQAVHTSVETARAFRTWRYTFLTAKTAQQYRNVHLMSKSIKALRLYTEHRKYVIHLSKLAHQHHMLVVFCKYFSPWLLKTEAQLKKKQVLHLWTSCTAREIELIPSEKNFTTNLEHRSLQSCFSVWLLKYQIVSRIRKVYQSHLLQWVFVAWKSWAGERHDHLVKSLHMIHRRRIKMTFSFWLVRMHQRKETERRYKEAWHSYLLLIFQQWRFWTKSSCKLNLSQRTMIVKMSQKQLLLYFCKWRTLAQKVKQIRISQTQRLLNSVLLEWRQVAKQIRLEKQKVFQLQTLSFMFLAKRMFYKWHACYTRCQILLQQRRHHAEQCALCVGLVWKKKVQKTRGQHLQTMLHRMKLACHFQHWKSSLSNIQQLYEIQDQWTQQKNVCLIKKFFKIWKIQLIAFHAKKVHTLKFLSTTFSGWKHFTRVSKERHKQGLIIQKSQQIKSLQVYFQYWLAVTKVKQSVQQNVETKLQIRVLRSWKYYTCKTVKLRKLQAQLTQHVKNRILRRAFMNLRWRAEYLNCLQEMADNIVRERKKARVRDFFDIWIDRQDSILADRFYQHILAMRGAKKWQRFVKKCQLMKARDEENLQKAVRSFHQRLCKKVFTALKLEVAIAELIKKRKENVCFKYAKIWKQKVDMEVTAVTMKGDFLQRQMWNKWRVQFTRIRATNRINTLLDRQLLSQVFHAWQGLCKKTHSRKLSQPNMISDRKLPSPLSSTVSSSMIPIPVNRSRSPSVSSPVFPTANIIFGYKSGRRN